MYPWNRFGPEEALQIRWTVKALHPELFADLDMRGEERACCRRGNAPRRCLRGAQAQTSRRYIEMRINSFATLAPLLSI
jgi:hypothetical protein